jgi:hypothetical protein
MTHWEIEETVFKHPFTGLVCGPTQSGKTYLMYQILLNNKIIINPQIERIIVCYGLWQPTYELFKTITPSIEFNEGIIQLDDFDTSKNTLIILDDLMEKCFEDINIQNLFTKNSHHKNISVFLLAQNLFTQAKYSRTISLNSHYLIIFKNPRDQTQISVLGGQMFPGNKKYLIDAFKDATESKKNGYLFIDLKQETENKNRVQSGIIPGDLRIIYTTN